MNREDVRKILKKYNVVMGDDYVDKLLLNPCDHKHVVDVLMWFTTSLMARIIATEIYKNCMEKT